MPGQPGGLPALPAGRLARLAAPKAAAALLGAASLAGAGAVVAKHLAVTPSGAAGPFPIVVASNTPPTSGAAAILPTGPSQPSGPGHGNVGVGQPPDSGGNVDVPEPSSVAVLAVAVCAAVLARRWRGRTRRSG